MRKGKAEEQEYQKLFSMQSSNCRKPIITPHNSLFKSESSIKYGTTRITHKQRSGVTYSELSTILQKNCFKCVKRGIFLGETYDKLGCEEKAQSKLNQESKKAE